MQIISVSNRKGGTGKTTVSVNLAAELAAMGQRVLLLDLDSQGHCGVGLGIKVESHETAVHHIFVDMQATLSQYIRATAVEGLWLAPADPRFDHGDACRDFMRLKRAIQDEQLSARFDIILIDTPPSLDALLMNALFAATRVLVPYMPHHLALEGVRQLVRALFPVMTRYNRDLKILGFVPTLQAEHIRQHRAVTGQIGKEFGSPRVLPGIRNDIRLAEAFAVGKPIRFYAPKSRGASDFGQLAHTVAVHLSAE